MLFPFNFLGSAFDPNAQAFISAAGITNPTQQNAINQLVIDLKTYGLWTKMKAVYPMVGGTASSCKYNLVNPQDTDAAFRLVFNGGWTFDNNGATPNGTNGYADTKFVMSTGFNINNSLSFYSRTSAIQSTSDSWNMGVGTLITGIPLYGLSAIRNGGSPFYDSGDYPNARTIGSGSNGNGFWIGSCTSASSRKFFRNDTLLATNTINQTPSLSLFPIYIGCLNNNNINQSQFVNNQFAFASIGDGLTDTDALNLYNRVQTFQTSISRQV